MSKTQSFRLKEESLLSKFKNKELFQLKLKITGIANEFGIKEKGTQGFFFLLDLFATGILFYLATWAVDLVIWKKIIGFGCASYLACKYVSKLLEEIKKHRGPPGDIHVHNQMPEVVIKNV